MIVVILYQLRRTVVVSCFVLFLFGFLFCCCCLLMDPHTLGTLKSTFFIGMDEEREDKEDTAGPLLLSSAPLLTGDFWVSVAPPKQPSCETPTLFVQDHGDTYSLQGGGGSPKETLNRSA